MCLSCDQPIAEEILGYLVARPNAQDTLEGIVEWWLLEQKIDVQTARVKETLAGLIADGLIIEGQAGGESRSFYKLNRRRLKTVLKMLGRKP
jgi:ribosomal protein L19E